MSFASTDAGYNGNVGSFNPKEVLASRFDLAKIVGGRMVPPSADTVYQAGQVLAQFSSGQNAGLWAPYDSANSGASDGSQKPIGVLLSAANVLPNGAQSEVSVIISGEVYADLLVTLVSGTATAGLPTAVATAMGGSKILIHGQNVYNF